MTSTDIICFSQSKQHIYNTTIDHAENVYVNRVNTSEKKITNLVGYKKMDSIVHVEKYDNSSFWLTTYLCNSGNAYARNVNIVVDLLVKRDRYLKYTNGKSDYIINVLDSSDCAIIKALCRFPYERIANDTLYLFINGTYVDYYDKIKPIRISMVHFPAMGKRWWYSPIRNLDSILDISIVPIYFEDR